MDIRDVYTAEKYTDKQGQEKTTWYKIGTAFIKEDGGIGLSLAAFPRSGQAQVFKRKPKEGLPQTQNTQQMQSQEDDLPF